MARYRCRYDGSGRHAVGQHNHDNKEHCSVRDAWQQIERQLGALPAAELERVGWIRFGLAQAEPA